MFLAVLGSSVVTFYPCRRSYPLHWSRQGICKTILHNITYEYWYICHYFSGYTACRVI